MFEKLIKKGAENLRRDEDLLREQEAELDSALDDAKRVHDPARLSAVLEADRKAGTDKLEASKRDLTAAKAESISAEQQRALEIDKEKAKLAAIKAELESLKKQRD